MSGKGFPPLSPRQQTGKPPERCARCPTKFDAARWPKSKWTLSGFSPWCPECHAQYARDERPKRRARAAKEMT